MRRAACWTGVGSALFMSAGLSLVSATPGFAAAPANDALSAAAALPSDASGAVSGSNLDATTQAGEPAPSDPSYPGWGASVWWSWTAPASGTYLFDTCGSDFPTALNLYTGDTVATLTDVSSGTIDHCMYDGSAFQLEERTVAAVAGSTYLIRVAGYDGAMGSVALRWWPQQAPGNDNFAAATPLASSVGHASGTDRFATRETSDPDLNGGLTVWWSWTPPSDGNYMFDTCGSNFDTRLGVYTGGALDALTPVMENDDACTYQSQVPFPASGGTTYHIAVAGFAPDAVGDISLNWQSDAPPANDDLGAATPVGGASGAAAGNSRFATVEAGEPTGSASVWWSWTAPRSGPVIFDTCGSDFYTSLGAYAGPDVADLATVADDNTAGCLGQSMITFDATVGTSYAIRVGTANRYNQFGGDVALNWRMGAPPGNDAFGSATVLAGVGGTATGSNAFATAETGEPTDLGVHTVWWAWTAPDATPVTFDTCGSSLQNTTLAVYTGSTVGALTTVVGTLPNWCGDQASVAFTPVAGTTYHVAVASQFGQMGPIVLHWPPSLLMAPGTPTNVSATAGSGKALVGWTAPVNPGGGITGYDVRYRRAGSGSWSTVSAGGTATHDIVSGLHNGWQYEFQVRAVSGALPGPWSGSAFATPTALSVTVDSATGGVNSITVAFTVAGGTWFDSTGAAVAHTQTCTVRGTTISVPCNTSPSTISPVPAGTRTVTVATTDADGTSASGTSSPVKVAGP